MIANNSKDGQPILGMKLTINLNRGTIQYRSLDDKPAKSFIPQIGQPKRSIKESKRVTLYLEPLGNCYQKLYMHIEPCFYDSPEKHERESLWICSDENNLLEIGVAVFKLEGHSKYDIQIQTNLGRILKKVPYPPPATTAHISGFIDVANEEPTELIYGLGGEVFVVDDSGQ